MARLWFVTPFQGCSRDPLPATDVKVCAPAATAAEEPCSDRVRTIPARVRTQAKALSQHRANIKEQEHRFFNAWRETRGAITFAPPATSAQDKISALKRRVLGTAVPAFC